ncbi:hypothetical protein BJX61DRAFT_48639 [Aspergillus egyptiacus]|nr:hypothetical protein BJX61DRAFT_48639 [Aspergillus egyptiacus]
MLLFCSSAVFVLARFVIARFDCTSQIYCSFGWRFTYICQETDVDMDHPGGHRRPPCYGDPVRLRSKPGSKDEEELQRTTEEKHLAFLLYVDERFNVCFCSLEQQTNLSIDTAPASVY